MEPIALILSALATGAANAVKDTVGKAVKDAYEGLKVLIKKKFTEKGQHNSLIILDKYEQKPEKTEALLKEELQDAALDKDKEVLDAAKEVMKSQDPEGFQAGKYNTNTILNVTLQGDVIGVAGTNTGTLNFGNITK
jgi:hypothetical protein